MKEFNILYPSIKFTSNKKGYSSVGISFLNLWSGHIDNLKTLFTFRMGRKIA